MDNLRIRSIQLVYYCQNNHPSQVAWASLRPSYTVSNLSVRRGTGAVLLEEQCKSWSSSLCNFLRLDVPTVPSESSM